MLNVETEGFPFNWERVVRGAAPAQVFEAVVRLLLDSGFHLNETEAPSTGAGPGTFSAALRGVRDRVVDAEQRRRGKIMLAGAGAIVLAVLVAVAMGAGDSREILSPTLLVSVVLGGMGLNKLRNPADIVRRLVDVRVREGVGEPGAEGETPTRGVLLTVREGVGRAEGDMLLEWIPGEQAEFDQGRFDELIESFVPGKQGEAGS